ncbi:hypothetical protein [Pedobacter kyonggii]|uniref:Uncharacterized protein n=1 Tax=Pedobacter kyonggii TaxID=1926871 RepID=A0A4Q9HGR0_9SPHI|nr:hypothetical protein [Pedobacter kyonggii]TBO44397.1 hypothetical protein EYS08_03550 [Pedobacter kyonggii]
MALIRAGSIDDFAVEARASLKLEEDISWTKMNKISEIREMTRAVEPTAFEFATSTEERGLGIKSLLLEKDFDGILGGLFDSNNEIYFVAWAWDLSGEPVYQYPGKDVNTEDVIIPMKSGVLREFIGEGINLFPKRLVKGGLGVRIQIWESDKKSRDFGEVLTQVADSIKKSEINDLLSLIALTGAPAATISTIAKASLELAGIIGAILTANSNDYVDFFEGYYSADKQWNTGLDNYNGFASAISLEKF